MYRMSVIWRAQVEMDELEHVEPAARREAGRRA